MKFKHQKSTKTTLSFLTICCYQNKTAILICFLKRERHKKIDIYCISESYFHLPIITIRNNSNIFILFKQTLRDIILLFCDLAGLDMNFEEWKQFCRKAWENGYDYLQIDRFAKMGGGVGILIESVIKLLIFIALLR